jgi:hypothetical protein
VHLSREFADLANLVYHRVRVFFRFGHFSLLLRRKRGRSFAFFRFPLGRQLKPKRNKLTNGLTARADALLERPIIDSLQLATQHRSTPFLMARSSKMDKEAGSLGDVNERGL